MRVFILYDKHEQVNGGNDNNNIVRIYKNNLIFIN